MGGYGSGTWQRTGTKDRVSSRFRIQIKAFNEGRRLTDEVTGLMERGDQQLSFSLEENAIVLGTYPSLDTIHLVAKPYRIEFQTTPCNFGGHRTWLTCPSCRGRKGVAYLEGNRFACRQCCDLAYDSQLESQAYGLVDKAAALRRRLGGSGSLVGPFPDKPKGMHYRTYWRILQQLVQTERAAKRALLAELYK